MYLLIQEELPPSSQKSHVITESVSTEIIHKIHTDFSTATPN